MKVYDCTENELFYISLQSCIPFWNFQSNYLTESLSITAYDSSSSALCDELCNVILRACRKLPKEDLVNWVTQRIYKGGLFITHSIFMLAKF